MHVRDITAITRFHDKVQTHSSRVKPTSSRLASELLGQKPLPTGREATSTEPNAGAKSATSRELNSNMIHREGHEYVDMEHPQTARGKMLCK